MRWPLTTFITRSIIEMPNFNSPCKLSAALWWLRWPCRHDSPASGVRRGQDLVLHALRFRCSGSLQRIRSQCIVDLLACQVQGDSGFGAPGLNLVTAGQDTGLMVRELRRTERIHCDLASPAQVDSLIRQRLSKIARKQAVCNTIVTILYCAYSLF